MGSGWDYTPQTAAFVQPACLNWRTILTLREDLRVPGESGARVQQRRPTANRKVGASRDGITGIGGFRELLFSSMTSRHLVVLLCSVALQLHPTAISARTAFAASRGIAQSGPEEISELQAKAEKGDAEAALRLARAYERGSGVTRNEESAFRWYRMAAEQGNAIAGNRVGEMYRAGEGVAENKVEALFWYHQAARRGNAEAMCNLGAAYYNGDGVVANEMYSYAWFLAAKEAGCERAADAVARAASEMPAYVVPRAMELIAEMYEKGDSLPSNEGRAVQWWVKAARAGDPDASATVGMMLLEGKGAPQDFSLGRQWCEKSVKEGSGRGEYCMGYLYQHGLGETRDANKARHWFEQGAKSRNNAAIKELAAMEVAGEGGKKNVIDGCVLYAQLAGTGEQDSLRKLAHLKRGMSSKDWKKVESLLPSVHVNPRRLDEQLRRIEAP
jgi:uncharacterized protein